VGWRYLDIADFLAIVERIFGSRIHLSGASDHLVGLAESALVAPAASFGGLEFYPELPRKAAVLFSHLARNHPLADGNKRVALLCMVEFIERNGYSIALPTEEQAEADFVDLLANVAASTVSEADFAEWIAARLSNVEPSESVEGNT
jgi:death on curing protein